MICLIPIESAAKTQQRARANKFSGRNSFFVNCPSMFLQGPTKRRVLVKAFYLLSVSDRLSVPLHFSSEASMLSLLDAPPVRARSMEVLGLSIHQPPPGLQIGLGGMEPVSWGKSHCLAKAVKEMKMQSGKPLKSLEKWLLTVLWQNPPSIFLLCFLAREEIFSLDTFHIRFSSFVWIQQRADECQAQSSSRPDLSI